MSPEMLSTEAASKEKPEQISVDKERLVSTVQEMLNAVAKQRGIRVGEKKTPEDRDQLNYDSAYAKGYMKALRDAGILSEEESVGISQQTRFL